MVRLTSVSTHRDRLVCCGGILLLPAVALLFFVAEGFAAMAEKETSPVVTAPEQSDVSTARIVIICSLFAPTDIPPIEQTIAAQLADLNVAIDFHYITDLPMVTDAQDALAKGLMDGLGATAAFIIYPGESQVVLRIVLNTEHGLETTSRTVDVASGTPLHEALGVIARAATTTIIERRRHKQPVPEKKAPRETAQAEPSALPVDPVSAESRKEVRRMYFTAGVALGLYSSGVPPWIGMDLSLGWQPIPHLFIHVGYVALSKVTKRLYDVTLTLRRNPVRFGLGYARPVKRLVLGGGVSLNIDYVTESISSRNEGVTPSQGGAEVHPALIGYLHLGIQIFGPLSFFMNLEAEIPLSSTEYGIATLEGDIVLLELLPVQPVFRAGLRVHFF